MAEKQSAHIQPLDGLRGMAVLMVMVAHYCLRGGFNGLPIPAQAVRFENMSWTGVDLFFVLSGFLITRILLAAREHPRYFSNFYVRRVLRIFPLYYLFLILYYFAQPLFKSVDSGGINSWWYFTYWVSWF